MKFKQSFYNVARLKKGRLPYGYKCWPDGSEAGKVVKPITLAPTSDNHDSRIVVPNDTGGNVVTTVPPDEDSAPRPSRPVGVLPFFEHSHLGLVVS